MNFMYSSWILYKLKSQQLQIQNLSWWKTGTEVRLQQWLSHSVQATLTVFDFNGKHMTYSKKPKFSFCFLDLRKPALFSWTVKLICLTEWIRHVTCFTWRWTSGLWRWDQSPDRWRWSLTASDTMPRPTDPAPLFSASSSASCGKTLPAAPWLDSKSTFSLIFCSTFYFPFCCFFYFSDLFLEMLHFHTLYSFLLRVLCCISV